MALYLYVVIDRWIGWWMHYLHQEIPVGAAAGSHVFSRPLRHGRRLLSSLQRLRPVGARLCRLLVRQPVHKWIAMLSQVPDLQAAWRPARRRRRSCQQMGTVRRRLARPSLYTQSNFTAISSLDRSLYISLLRLGGLEAQAWKIGVISIINKCFFVFCELRKPQKV